jgi:hypothetical protein
MNSAFIKAQLALCAGEGSATSRSARRDPGRYLPRARAFGETVKQIHHIPPRRFNAVSNPSPTEEVAFDRMALVAPVKDQLDLSRLVMALRSLSVFFFFRSSNSHFTGLISPLVLHHLTPVHMPNIRLPSESQTRTAL